MKKHIIIIMSAGSLFYASSSFAVTKDSKQAQDEVAAVPVASSRVTEADLQNEAGYPVSPTGRPWARDMFDEFEKMRYSMQRMVGMADQLWESTDDDLLTAKEGDFLPNMTVQRGKEEFLVVVDLPGVNKSDISAEVKDNTLTVSGVRKQVIEEENKQGNQYSYVASQKFGSFSRVLRLPDDVDHKKMKANYANGVLTIRIPYLEKKEESHKVQIS